MRHKNKYVLAPREHAYFTAKSGRFSGKPSDGRQSLHFGGAVGSSDRERIPDIYSLALTKYYATLPFSENSGARQPVKWVDVLDALILPILRSARFYPYPGQYFR